MRAMVKRFAMDERGSATSEYGLIAAGLSLAILAILQGIALKLSGDLGQSGGGPR